MNGIAFERDTIISQSGNAVCVCGPSTGHSIKPVAFCQNGIVATDIVSALNLWKKAAINEREKPIECAPLGSFPAHQMNSQDT